jgi:Sulfotransferase family
VPDLRQVPERGVKHSTLAQGLAMEPGLAAYWIFGFVRNPWARLVSWWSMVQRFKQLAETPGGDPARAMFARNRFLRTAREYGDFETFVLRGPETLERLRTPQVTYLRAGGREADFVGRTESLTADLGTAFEHLGLATPPAALPHSNRSSSGHYSAYYTDAARERVAELFAADIAAYGYTFERA